MKIVETPAARRDKEQIWAYIAGDNEQAADGFFLALQRLYQLLGRFPEAGRRRRFVGLSGVRSFPVPGYRNWLAFYEVDGRTIRIIRIVSGYQDLNAIFGA